MFPHARRPVRATQIDDGAVPAAADVDMRGTVIVRIDHGAQAIEAEHGRHTALLAETEALGYEMEALETLIYRNSPILWGLFLWRSIGVSTRARRPNNP
jgi:hypothetical protein